MAMLGWSVGVFAQGDCPCCDEPHRQFDFWVGEWTVKDSLGNPLGENSISKMEGNCIVTEHWKGAQGGTGSSWNYYDKADSTWNQVWIDNSGGILKLKGRFENGAMRLKSELTKGRKIDWYYNRITWTPRMDGTVTQVWEILDADGNVRAIAFSGIYKRMGG